MRNNIINYFAQVRPYLRSAHKTTGATPQTQISLYQNSVY